MNDIAETPLISSSSAGTGAKEAHPLIKAGGLLAEDLASSLVFAGAYALGHNALLATSLAVATGVGQIGWRLTRRLPIDALQWMSLGLVVVFGAASILTNDPRIMMLKPTLIYAVIGAAMLKRGWMTRYMPPEALSVASDLVITFGYVWAGLMFATAGLNLALVNLGNTALWAGWLAVFPLVSKVGLFTAQYAITNIVARRRLAAA